MATSVDIADAVVTELNAGTFGLPFTAQRRLLPEYKLQEMEELRVTVVPQAVEISLAHRSACQNDIQIDIGVQKKITADLDTEAAQLIVLVEEIIDYLRLRRLTDVPQVLWIRTRNEPIYAREHLAQQRLFTSVLTVTYRLVR